MGESTGEFTGIFSDEVGAVDEVGEVGEEDGVDVSPDSGCGSAPHRTKYNKPTKSAETIVSRSI